ncbi:14117_t:CDS:1, partial [Funneliformis caledonium]
MARTSSKLFPKSFLNPKKKDTNLIKKALDMLVKYYCDVYNDKDFMPLSKIYTAQSNAILVLLKVNIYGRLQLDAKVFGS